VLPQAQTTRRSLRALSIMRSVTNPADDVPSEREPTPEGEAPDVEEISENGGEHNSPTNFLNFPKVGDLPLRIFSPKVDFSIFPKIDPPDLSALIPKIGLPDLSPLLPKIQLPNLMPTIRPLIGELTKALAPLIEKIRESLPPNWPSDLDLDALTTAIRDDGLPLVWVPRADVVTELLATSGRSERVQVLVSHTSEVIEDCRTTLGEVTHASLSGQQTLAEKSLDAFENGHYEAAQALAVVVTETAVTHFFAGKRYAEIKEEVDFDLEDVYLAELRVQAALAPIGVFFTTWYPSSGAPAPEALSRHVSVHQADRGHYTRGNATVAVLLVTSVLRALQELQETLGDHH
jgi:hypothetical protein